jgi:hypothetical protein
MYCVAGIILGLSSPSISTILKAPVSTVVCVIFYKKNPYISSKSTQRKILKSDAAGGVC